MDSCAGTIKVPSRTSSIKKVSSGILEQLLPYKVSEERLFDITLCIEEAVRNAIIHGNRSDLKLQVKVDYSIDGDNIAVEVEDEGAGFQPARVPDPTEECNITKESGRGLHLIVRLMDRVEFNKRGNRIRMEKSLR
ncbi:MAG: ATP-binding protein [Candidatus Omnitrophica bacterium]|nr:ATP-binding protein [Candidatus Omnitrophota bacterium]